MFNYMFISDDKVKNIINRNFHILKNNPETSAIFTDNPLISFGRNKNILNNLVRRQNLCLHQRVTSCSRACCYTCSFLNSATSFSGHKSIVIRHIILHAPSAPTLSIAFLLVVQRKLNSFIDLIKNLKTVAT